MRNLKIYILGFLSLFLTQSCSVDSTSDVSSVTNFAVITLGGPSEFLLHEGDPYVEPGATATENGNNVEVTTQSVGLFTGGSLDVDTPDIYSLSYSAINSDGFASAAARTVIVAGLGDLVTDLSGLYTSTIVRNGVSGAQYTDIHYILIWKKANGDFQFSDGIGGYYMFGRGYGLNYAAQGATVTVNGENDFTFGPTFGVGAFGGNADMTEMTTDSVAKTIDFTTEWDAGYTFVVHLEQVQF